MHRRKIFLVLAALLASAVPLVWCRAESDPPKKKKTPAPAASVAKPAGPAKPAAANPPAGPARSNAGKSGPEAAPGARPAPVDLGGSNDRKSIDFTSGKPVVTDSAEDKVAINSALKDFKEASKGVTFGPPKKKAAPAAKN